MTGTPTHSPGLVSPVQAAPAGDTEAVMANQASPPSLPEDLGAQQLGVEHVVVLRLILAHLSQ